MGMATRKMDNRADAFCALVEGIVEPSELPADLVAI
jgi:hypothetical protein